MTTYEKIVKAVKPLGINFYPDIKTVPRYDVIWITYNMADDYGSEFADDEPYVTVNSVQVHLFMSEEALGYEFYDLKTKIRKALFNAGFTWPEVTMEVEEDGRIRHLIFECDIEEDVEI